MTLLTELRQRTGPWHRRIEAELPLLSPGADTRTYRRYLVSLWGFHAPIERDLSAVPGLEHTGLELEARRKCPALAADLCALGQSGADIARLPWCAFTPPIGDVPSALGCLYVLEGATLGGQVLFRELSERLPETMQTASRYLRVYGADTAPRWRSFTRVLAEISPTTTAGEALVGAACATFAALERWLAQSPVTASERSRQGAASHG